MAISGSSVKFEDGTSMLDPLVVCKFNAFIFYELISSIGIFAFLLINLPKLM